MDKLILKEEPETGKEKKQELRLKRRANEREIN